MHTQTWDREWCSWATTGRMGQNEKGIQINLKIIIRKLNIVCNNL